MEVSEWIVTVGCAVAVLLCGRLAYVALVARDAAWEMLNERRFGEIEQLEGKKVQVWATDLRVVIDHLYLDELKDFLGTEPHARGNHLFQNVRRLMECLD
jgi:hypothetical protein